MMTDIIRRYDPSKQPDRQDGLAGLSRNPNKDRLRGISTAVELTFMC